jgi:hypothetical protein
VAVPVLDGALECARHWRKLPRIVTSTISRVFGRRPPMKGLRAHLTPSSRPASQALSPVLQTANNFRHEPCGLQPLAPPDHSPEVHQTGETVAD